VVATLAIEKVYLAGHCWWLKQDEAQLVKSCWRKEVASALVFAGSNLLLVIPFPERLQLCLAISPIKASTAMDEILVIL
jgi:hypothetical protein